DAGHVKVMDFGVSGRTPAADVPADSTADVENASTVSDKLTMPGEGGGTPPYMSPEQLRGRETDGRSDLFALGVMLFEALTGHHPFHGGNSVETAAAILHNPPRTDAGLKVLELQGELGKTILALLEKNPAARPHSAAEAARRLHVAASELTGVLAPSAQP